MKRNKLIAKIMICLGVIPLLIMTFWVDYIDYITSQNTVALIISLLIFMGIFFGVCVPFIIIGVNLLIDSKDKVERREQ